MTDYLARAMEQDAEEEKELAAELDALPEGGFPPRAPQKPRAETGASRGEDEDAPTSLPGGVSDPSGEGDREAERPLAEALSALDRALGNVSGSAGGEVSRAVRTAQLDDGPAPVTGETARSAEPVQMAGAEAPEDPALRALERAMRPLMYPEKPPTVRDTAPSDAPGPAAGPEGADAALSLLDRVRKAQRGASFVQSERRALTVALPEPSPAAPAWSVEDLDRAVERDARRGGGDFRLY